MRARPFLAFALILLLAGCSSTPSESADIQPVETELETYALTIEVIDAIPLDLAMNVNDKSCRPSAIFSKADGARIPAFVVEDAAGTTVATGEISSSGAWADDECTLVTDLGDVPASDFYTIRLSGDDGLFKVEPFEYETTVQAEPVDGAVLVEWQL